MDDTYSLSQPLRLCPSITISTSFCMWSRVHAQLAIGTTLGKVIVFNKKEGVMQLHDRKGKHGAPVTCGACFGYSRIRSFPPITCPLLVSLSPLYRTGRLGSLCT